MLPLIASKKAELEALCRRHHVRRLDVFGSAARGDFDPAKSDIDFLVEFEPDQEPLQSFSAFLDLKESLEAIFERSIDLIEEGGVRNPYVKASIERSREPVFMNNTEVA